MLFTELKSSIKIFQPQLDFPEKRIPFYLDNTQTSLSTVRKGKVVQENNQNTRTDSLNFFDLFFDSMSPVIVDHIPDLLSGSNVGL